MGRSLAIFLRLGIIVSAAMILLALFGHAHAQEMNGLWLVADRAEVPVAALARSDATIPRGNPDYRLGTGDKLRITVFGQNDLSGEYQIDGAGTVRLPLIGAIQAKGLTAAGLESAVASSLAGGYLVEPKVAVEIVTYRPFYIIGAVGRPGEYPYVSAMTTLNAVALAGGFLPSAVESVVYVRHEGEAREHKIVTDQLTEIRPGDVIRVDTTIFWDAMTLLSPLANPFAITAAAAR